MYPFDSNPYQEMLYGAIRASGVECTVIYIPRRRRLGPIPFLVQVAAARIRGYRLLHLHWPQFALHRGGRILPRLSLLNARLSLWWLRTLGVRLVWTVHNAVPHEQETADDTLVSRILARDAALKIVHSVHVIEELEATGADTQRIVVIPHGGYDHDSRGRPREGRREVADLSVPRIFDVFCQFRFFLSVSFRRCVTGWVLCDCL